MKSLMFAALLMPMLAFATHPTDPPTTPAPSVVNVDSHAVSNASSHSSSLAGAKSNATGGNASATGGSSVANGGAGGDASASQTQTANGGSADNAGNSQTLEVTSNYERNAPSVGQGSLYIPQCGVAGNAGGSNTSGSAFLGFAFTPADCKLLLTAAAYQAIGMYDAACEMVNQVSVAKKYWSSKKEGAPSCETKKETVALVPHEDFDPANFLTKEEGKSFVTKTDQDERDKRMLRTLSK